ncbi:MAG: c-type cytochrome biogenesis protein CcsB [Treponemataceae bacterium]
MDFTVLELNFFWASVVLYFVATVAYFLFFVIKKEFLGRIAYSIIFSAFFIQTMAIIFRSIAAKRLPLTNQYEFATSFAWGIVLCFFIFERLYKFKALGTFVSPIVFLIIGYASMQNKAIRELMPALQSNWLSFHVSTAIISYGAFGVSFATSILYLIRSKMADSEFNKKNIPSLDKIDLITYRTVALGFLFLTLVIVTGAIWAERAWGRYWSWDPKETWSLVTWIIYALYLHVRLSRGWEGKPAALFAIIGFSCVIITYIGVNIFMPSIHSYA